MRGVPPVAWQVLRFGIVGVANTVTTLTIIWLLRDGLGAPVWLASAIGYVAGMIQGFLLSRYWTFAGADHAHGPRRQALGFAVVNLICGTVFTRLNVAFAGAVPLLAASLLSAVAVLPLSFALNRWIVFRPVSR